MKGTLAVAFLVSLFAGSLCDVFSIRLDDNTKTPKHTETCLTQRVSCRYGNEEFPNFDGTCNNLVNPTWGAAKSVQRRLLPPEYDDSTGSPRQHGKFRALPSTRKVSNALKAPGVRVSSSVSHMHALWGQLLAHDIIHTPVMTAADHKPLDCNCDRPALDCFNIKIPADDVQRREEGKKCFGLPRSQSATGIDGCSFAHREQITSMSSVIDGTFLYGKSDDEANELRDFSSPAGEMKLVNSPASAHHKNLPNQDQLGNAKISDTIVCIKTVHKPVNVPCFVAGDVRVNENPGLQSMHTIWARYHNLVARGLKKVNPYWNSNRVFNVARRIISALLQSLTYRQYLSPLLGPTWMNRYGLVLTNNGYWNGYDPRYNLALPNSFTTAACRYGHSQIGETLSRPSPFFAQSRITDVPSASSFFSNEALLEKNGGGSGALLRGFMVDNAEKTDDTFAEAMRNHLFVPFGKKFGGDLFAINLQRGRDHGLPGYNKFRELCGLSRASNFYDLAKEINQHHISKLQALYDHVDDIDLYAGALAENHVVGGEVGPTFACILGEGYRALRRGDRYWHEYENSPSPFTQQQLRSLRQTTLASVICQTGEDMKYVVKNAMLMQEGKHGRIINCGNVVNLDISLWRDARSVNAYSFPLTKETEWTMWFVTSETDEWKLNVDYVKRDLMSKRPEDICDNSVDHETRKVRGDRHVQIRFSCYVGEIKSTDLPFQISQNHRWTQWIHRQYVEGYEFGCSKVVAIQAMTLQGEKYALETGDVFKKFGPNGFSCHDGHQPSGYCHKYKVRGLCVRKDQPLVEPTSVLYSEGPQNEYPTQPPAPYSSGLSQNVQDKVNLYCREYGLCCRNPPGFYHAFIPPAIIEDARNMCVQHRAFICCDA